jgi:hypothetical protein
MIISIIGELLQRCTNALVDLAHYGETFGNEIIYDYYDFNGQSTEMIHLMIVNDHQ